jgi:serine/threonine-protein kinase SRPK3
MKERRSYPESIIKLLDHFEHAGPNGLHLCLVLELMWGDVGNMMGGLGSYDLPDIRKIVNKEVAKQVLNGLEVLAEMGIMHNGRKFFLNVAYFRPTSSELPSDL